MIFAIILIFTLLSLNVEFIWVLLIRYLSYIFVLLTSFFKARFIRSIDFWILFFNHKRIWFNCFSKITSLSIILLKLFFFNPSGINFWNNIIIYIILNIFWVSILALVITFIHFAKTRSWASLNIGLYFFCLFFNLFQLFSHRYSSQHELCCFYIFFYIVTHFIIIY